MATNSTSQVIEHLRRVLRQDEASLTDGQLLECFVEGRDEAAFAALVKRHSRLVWNVCRRLLSQHDAEDAFQATFLVLCRKAASIRRREMLASWLYAVAHQTALRVRRAAVRRRAREMQVVDMPEPAVVEQDLWHDLQPLLDQELSRLPDHYQVVILLCDMEGKTRKEVARQLGLPEGTVGSRLARARTLLAKRLARHGLAVSGSVLAMVLSQNAMAAGAPAPVVDAMIKAATLVAAGQAATGLISAQAAALSEGVIRVMTVVKLRFVLVLLLGICVSAAGAAFYAAFADPAPKPGREAPAPAAPGDRIRTDAFGDPLPRGVIARLGPSRFRHGGNAYMVAFSPDGQLLASAGEGGIKLWDRATGRLLRAMGHDTGTAVASLAFAPDGKTLASAGLDDGCGVQLWDVATGRQLHLLPTHRYGRPEALNRVVFSPNGATLISGGIEGVVQVWDVASGAELLKLRTSVPQGKGNRQGNVIWCLAVSPDGTTIAVAADDRTIRLWDLKGGRPTREIPVESEWVRDLAFAPDGKAVAWCGTSGTPGTPSEGIRIWDLEANREKCRLPGHVKGRTYGIAFTRDGRRLASAGYPDTVKLWDLATGKELWTGVGHVGTVWSVAFAPKDDLLASGSKDGSLRLWNVATGKEQVATPGGHWGPVVSVSVTRDGKSVLLGGEDAVVRVCDLATGWLQRSFPVQGRGTQAFAFSRDGRTAAVSYGAIVNVWDVAAGTRVWSSKEFHKPGPALASPFPGTMTFSADGKRLVCATGEADSDRAGRTVVRVWDAANGELLTQVARPRAFARSLALGPDGQTVTLFEPEGDGSRNMMVRVCELATGRVLHEWTAPRLLSGGAPAMAPDGKTVATGGFDSRIDLWDVASGKPRFSLLGPRFGATTVLFAFSPDGKRLAAASDGRVEVTQVWDVASGRRTHEFRGPATALAFSPDGTKLVANGRDVPALVWDLDTPAPPPPALSRREIEDRWLRLGYGRDSSRGNQGNYQRLDDLVEGGDAAVALLERELLDPKLPERDQAFVRQFVGTLADQDRAVRARAAREIHAYGDDAYLLAQGVDKAPVATETRQALEQVLLLSLEHRRISAAVKVLGHIATPQARRLLKRLAQNPEATPEGKTRGMLAQSTLDDLKTVRLPE